MIILHELLRKPILAITALSARLSPWRVLQIRVQARLYSATVQTGHHITIAHPVRFQGFGTLIIEDEVQLGYFLAGLSNSPIHLQPRETSAVIRICRGAAIMNGCELVARSAITIGRNSRIGPGCVFMDSDFHALEPDQRDRAGVSRPILLGDNVWFGRAVTVLKGVSIGKDAVVGAGCVVAGDIPPGAIVVGNPMRVVGSVYESGE